MTVFLAINCAQDDGSERGRLRDGRQCQPEAPWSNHRSTRSPEPSYDVDYCRQTRPIPEEARVYRCIVACVTRTNLWLTHE